MELVKKSKVTGWVITADWKTGRLKLETRRDGSWMWNNQRWRRVANFLLSKMRTLTVLTFDEDGYPTVADKKVEKDDNQEWEMMLAPEAPAAQSIETGTTLHKWGIMSYQPFKLCD